MKGLRRWWNRNKQTTPPPVTTFVFWAEKDDYEFLDFVFKERRAKGMDEVE